MSPVIVGLISLIILFALLAIGLPIGLGMALLGFAGLWYLASASAAVAKMALVPWDTITSYSLGVLPLFILMAHVCFASGLTTDLYNLASKWLGSRRGGLAMATVGACAGFAAVSASSLATAATMGLTALPEMKRYKYDPALSTGVIAAGGTIGILIPPSGVLIIYGILTEQSIGTLFAAGIVPGILEAIFYMVTIYVLCLWKPQLGPPGPSSSFKEKIMAFGSCGEVIGLIILVLGGLIIGWFTPTEAGAVGAFGAILFSLIRKRLSWQKFKHSLVETARTAGMIYLILIGALIFGFFMATTTIPFRLAEIVGGLPIPALGIMALIMLVYLVLGCFLDAPAMTVLTVPIFFPLCIHLGFSPIWFGVLVVRAMEMGMITPPIGMNVYVIHGVAGGVPLQTIFRGIVPFLIADFFHVALLLFVPQVALFIPSIAGMPMT
jgi:C4-dicarboxylate transporter DctM subunit